jgi:hypothetical protein
VRYADPQMQRRLDEDWSRPACKHSGAALDCSNVKQFTLGENNEN